MDELMAAENNKDSVVTQMTVSESGTFLIINLKPSKEPASRTGSVIHAALTTTYGRVALYQLINQYQDQVAYMDTGSSSYPPAFLGTIQKEGVFRLCHPPSTTRDAATTHFNSTGPAQR